MVLIATGTLRAQGTAPGDLDKAIAALRHIDQSKIPQETREAKAAEVQQAWETLTAARDKGTAALQAELLRIDKTGERDDFFKLSAAGLFWRIGGLEQAPAIAAIWEKTPLHVQYNYTFLSALEAAKTHDPRALPMLTACLQDHQGTFFVPTHSLNLTWPLTHEFLWGIYGPTGLPVLGKLLETSKDPVQLESAIWLLAHAQHLDSLKSIRRIAASGQGSLRRMAVRSLGFYGHPDDYDALIAGLKTKDPEQAFMCVAALYDFGDLRAVDHVLPLLKSTDEKLSGEVQSCLMHLLTPASFEGLRAYVDTLKDDEEKKNSQDFFDHVLGQFKMDWPTYLAKDAGQKKALFTALRETRESHFRLAAADRPLSREQFLEATAEWKENRRITGEKYGWVESRHVLSVATPDDIPLLLEVKAAVLLRLSDECLYETRTLDDLVQRLGRSRYRKIVDVCEKVEPK